MGCWESVNDSKKPRKKTPQKYISEQRQNKPDKQSSVQHVSETSCHRPLATKRIKKKNHERLDNLGSERARARSRLLVYPASQDARAEPKRGRNLRR